MQIDYNEGVYFAKCTFEERLLFRQAGWVFSARNKRWETSSDSLANLFLDCAVGMARERLVNIQLVTQGLIAASSAVDSDEEFWSPEGKRYLGYQKAGISFLLATKFALLADAPGVGKTIQILGVVNNSTVKSVLIIAPASLKYNWLKESKRWLRDDLTVGITDTHVQTKTKTKEAARTHLWPDTDVVITTYDMMEEYSAQIHAKTWDLVACDEAHVLSNKQAQRTKRVLGGGKGKKKILPIPALRMIFATGTPILKKPINLWPIVEKCDPMGIGKDYMEFVMRYCGGYHNSYGLFKDGATNLEELQIKMRSKFMVRRLKADVLKDLPPKNRQVFELPPEGLKRVVRKELEVFERNLAALHSQNTGEKLDELTDASAEEIVKFIDGVREASRTYGEIDLEDYMKIHFEAMALAREEVGMAKVPMVVEYVKRIVDDGQKVVVMTFHKTVAETLLKEFPGAAFVTGKVPAKKRQDEVDRFQEDPDCMVFIGNIAAAGVGLTLTAAYNLVFAEFSWSPAEMEQAEDRIHRIGQENHAHIHYLVVRGSIEAAVINILIEKQEIIEQALNINKLVDIR